MNFYLVRKNYPEVILILAIGILTLIKLPYFTMPFYWDEAWSYAMAIFDMADKGPTLIPGHANEWFTRGHPLFYYFLSSLWLKIFGAHLLSAHIFSFIIAIAALIVTFFIFSRLSGHKILGLVVSLALMVQSIFVTQSTMLLPEILLMTLGLLTLYFYYRGTKLGYIVAASLLVLTKETGLVFITFILFDNFILKKLFFSTQSELNKQFLKSLFLLSIPIFVFIVFLIVQKKNLGYFLFPEHTGMLVKDPKVMWENFINYISLLVWGHGRNFWVIIAIPCLVWGMIKKRYSKSDVYLITSVVFFMLAYMLFSAINFFTTRYLLSAIPWYLFVVTLFIYKPLAGNLKLFVGVVLAILLINGYITLSQKGEGDTVLSYRHTVEVHREAVNYCETQGWHDKNIYTGFLMQFNLKYPHLGYLKYNKPVGHFVNEDSADVLIFYSNEPSPLIEKFKSDTRYVSLIRFEKKGAWVEIIKKK